MLNLSSITEKSDHPEQLAGRLKRLFDKACKKLQRIIKGDVLMDTAFFLSSKRGPNGPVLETLKDDATAFTQEEKLVEAWRTLNEKVHSTPVSIVGFGDGIIRSLSNPPTLGPVERRSTHREALLQQESSSGAATGDRTPVHSRIAAIAAGGCKTRVVAICDWFTQDALKPLHEWSYR